MVQNNEWSSGPKPKTVMVEYPSGDPPEQLPHYIIRLKSKEIESYFCIRKPHKNISAWNCQAVSGFGSMFIWLSYLELSHSHLPFQMRGREGSLLSSHIYGGVHPGPWDRSCWGGRNRGSFCRVIRPKPEKCALHKTSGDATWAVSAHFHIGRSVNCGQTLSGKSSWVSERCADHSKILNQQQCEKKRTPPLPLFGFWCQNLNGPWGLGQQFQWHMSKLIPIFQIPLKVMGQYLWNPHLSRTRA